MHIYNIYIVIHILAYKSTNTTDRAHNAGGSTPLKWSYDPSLFPNQNFAYQHNTSDYQAKK